MPELPEVEPVRKGLQQLVLGKTIAKVEVFWPRIIESPEVALFSQSLVGQTIEAIKRRGKFLIFKLPNFLSVKRSKSIECRWPRCRAMAVPPAR